MEGGEEHVRYSGTARWVLPNFTRCSAYRFKALLELFLVMLFLRGHTLFLEYWALKFDC